MAIKSYKQVLQDLLEVTGWTQSYLAQHLQVTFATLNRWINGHAVPQPAHLKTLERLHREMVGLPAMGKREYDRLLKRASCCHLPTIRTLLQDNSQLEREFVVDGTYNSNTIEGTTLSFRETELLIYQHQSAANRPFVDQLVTSNHATILKDILRGKYGDRRLHEADIQEMHRRLFQGVREDAGAYSKFQRAIVGLNIQLPHPEDIPSEMDDFLNSLHRGPKDQHPIEFMANSHASFELIHPFGDGNGRIGRLLMVIQCLQFDYPPIVIENKRKADYYETLEHAQCHKSDHLVQFLVEELERAYGIVKKYR